MPALEGAKQGFKRCNAGGKDLIAGFFHVREALQHKVDANGLFATELLVFEVCIMNHLGDLRNDRIVCGQNGFVNNESYADTVTDESVIAPRAGSIALCVVVAAWGVLICQLVAASSWEFV
jgi:hypothetical protein